METNSFQYPSLRTRLAAVLIILAVLFAVGLAAILYVNFSEEMNISLVQKREYLLRVIIIFLSTLPLLVISAIIATNYFIGPITEISDAARRISKGQLTFRITKMPHTRELAELATDLNAMTENLSNLINSLERRVAERTTEISQKSDHRRAASYIARQTAEAQDLPSLLNTVVNLVTEQFGFYHTGIFLINETGTEVVLQAASSEGGQRMIESGHSLSVGAQSIVGSVVAQKKSRIALDVGPEAVFFNNPDLPMTRSEIALPLLVRKKVLGILDIQSDKPHAFSTEDIDVLETLADQVAVAIDNIRLIDESQAAFMQLEALTTLRTREVWGQKLQEKEHVFTYTPLGLRAEKFASDGGNEVIIPITLRGQKIGKISVARKNDTEWKKVDGDLIAEIASQVGLAVDNIRLLEEATQRAKQEQVVGEMAFRFSQALDIDSLLQTATRELGQLPGVEEATVFIGEISDQEKATTSMHRKSIGGRRSNS